MSDIKVINNALDVDTFDNIKNTILGCNFQWYYSDSKVTEEDKSIHNFQFSHVFFKDNEQNSSFIKILNPIFEILKAKIFIRIKANLTTKSDKVSLFQMHTDIPDLNNQKYKSAIFYLNTTNGQTVFENTKIDCIENRLVIFDGNIPHTASTHTDTKIRAVVNFNYFMSDVDL